MKMRKTLVALLIAICMIISIYTLGVFAEGINQVTASTNSSIAQGSYGYCYVYLEDLTDLASLTVAVHYDTDKVTVINSYNRVACTLYDSSNQSGCLQYSYIFDGEGSNTKTQLFYFRYQVKSTATAGDTYFDIVVSDAYTAELETVNISGSRCAFTITEQAASQKSCSIYSSSSVSTSVEEEFTLSYRLSTYQIASGSFTIQYDPELFEFVELTKNSFLNNKIVDVNPALSGAVSVSFVGTAYANSSNLITVKFRTLKNVAQSSDIKLTVIDFYDLELNSYSCSGYTSKVNIAFDETYTEDAPSMCLSSAYNAETSKVTLTVKLEKDAHLGAGDFVLNFDPQKLTYLSSEKGFAPTFFNINDSHVANGILKFSIISMADITDEQTVLTITFDAKHFCEDTLTMFEISGNGLTDSMTNAIMLNFVDSSVVISGKGHNLNDAIDASPTCTASGLKRFYCTRCDYYKTEEIPALGHDTINHEAKVPTCTEIGWNAYETCSRCDYSTYVEIPANGHDEISHSAQAPTCTEIGWHAYVTCSRCDYTTYVEIPSKGGHTFGEWERIIDPTPDTAGMDRRTCSVCSHYENHNVAALGYLQAFIDAVETLSNNASAENTYSELYSALQLYSRLTDDEKQEANEEFLVLQAAINAYNSKAEMANTEFKNATEIAFIPIATSFTFLAALWFLLKKKFWIK